MLAGFGQCGGVFSFSFVASCPDPTDGANCRSIKAKQWIRGPSVQRRLSVPFVLSEGPDGGKPRYTSYEQCIVYTLRMNSKAYTLRMNSKAYTLRMNSAICVYTMKEKESPFPHALGGLFIGGKKGQLPSCPHRWERDERERKGKMGTCLLEYAIQTRFTYA